MRTGSAISAWGHFHMLWRNFGKNEADADVGYDCFAAEKAAGASTCGCEK
jgi:hypothetical protein